MRGARVKPKSTVELDPFKIIRSKKFMKESSISSSSESHPEELKKVALIKFGRLSEKLD